MQTLSFGRTDLKVSRLTMGCGAVGGLMTKGRPVDQDNAVAWARDNGINFFDTAALYGNGASEENLGRALAGNTEGITVSTKVWLTDKDLDDVTGAVERSLNESLTRLKLNSVDLLQLHNSIGLPDRFCKNDADQLLAEIQPAFDKVRAAGKVRYFGFTANGTPEKLTEWVESEVFDSAQIFYNLLVPSAGKQVSDNHHATDYQQLLTTSAKHGVGAIGVRVLAGGALSGNVNRHPLGMPVVDPIGSDTDYATDVKLGLRFQPLIDAGHATSLAELAMRYVISNPQLPTTEIGIATLDELQTAAMAINKGPLQEEALELIEEIQAAMV